MSNNSCRNVVLQNLNKYEYYHEFSWGFDFLFLFKWEFKENVIYSINILRMQVII